MDPNKLSLPSRGLAANRKKAPRHKSGERFLRGPIPWSWLCAASKACGTGSGFKVAIVIWYLSGLNGQAKTVKLSGSVLRQMDLPRIMLGDIHLT